MFAKIPRPLYETISKEPSVYYFHTKCFTMEKYRADGLLKDVNVLATNKDLDGMEYATLIEHKKYPFYGSQFHPEKIGFEWNPKISIERPKSGVLFAQYLLNFFMSEVERSRHTFVDPAVLNKIDIDNYPSLHTMILQDTLLTTHYFLDVDTYDKPVIDFRVGRGKYNIIKRSLNVSYDVKF